MSRRRLAFYDHHRQNYASKVPLRRSPSVVAEFGVGFYAKNDPGTIWPGGEFKVILYEFEHNYGPTSYGGLKRPRPANPPLTPQLLVFDDGYGALREFDRVGGLAALEKADLRSRDNLSRVLLGLGLRDDSDNSLPGEEEEA